MYTDTTGGIKHTALVRQANSSYKQPLLRRYNQQFSFGHSKFYRTNRQTSINPYSPKNTKGKRPPNISVNMFIVLGLDDLSVPQMLMGFGL